MKTRHIITILAALPLLAAFSSCKSDEETTAKPAKEMLIVLGGNIEYRASEEGTEVPVTADCRWTVTYDQGNFDGDLTVQPSQGNGNGTLIIRSNQNTMPNTNREATITLTSDGGLQQRITVRQTSGDPSLNISKDAFAFAANTTEAQLLTVSSNGNWQLQRAPGVSWYHITDADGNDVTAGSAGATVLYVSVDPAVSDAVRTSTFAIQYNNKSVEVAVSQEGITTIRLTAPGQLDDIAAEGGEQQFSIESNAEWQAYIPSSVDWLRVEPDHGVGNGTLRVFCERTTSALDRLTAIVIIAGTKNPQQAVVLVEQRGLDARSTVTTVSDLYSLYVGSTSAEFRFSFVADNEAGDFGLVYSTTNQQPTTADNVVTAGRGSTAKNVMASLDALQPLTTYYVRAYVVANTGEGIVYSPNVVTITTSSSLHEPGESDNPSPSWARSR